MHKNLLLKMNAGMSRCFRVTLWVYTGRGMKVEFSGIFNKK
jgi:hypothetical protein